MTQLLDFYADWCVPCQQMKPTIEELEGEFGERIVKINIDEQGDKVSEYGVMSVPTYIIAKDGKEVKRFIGFTSKEELAKALKDS